MPDEGKLVLFDRSWYTRALTEPTLGYCTKPQYEDFMNNVNKWEDKLIKNGLEVVKFYFSIDKDQQKDDSQQENIANLNIGSYLTLINAWLTNGMFSLYTRTKCLTLLQEQILLGLLLMPITK